MYIQSSMKEINFMSELEGASNEHWVIHGGAIYWWWLGSKWRRNIKGTPRTRIHHFCSSSISSDVKQNVNNFFLCLRSDQGSNQTKAKQETCSSRHLWLEYTSLLGAAIFNAISLWIDSQVALTIDFLSALQDERWDRLSHTNKRSAIVSRWCRGGGWKENAEKWQRD